MSSSSKNAQKSSKLRGRFAIDSAHTGITKDEEGKVTLEISKLYGVDLSEATEIHTNYHVQKILSQLKVRSSDQSLPDEILAKMIESLDVNRPAYHVANGEITELVAVDSLYRKLFSVSNEGDRYTNFYG